jgi:hypothetical protein
MSGWRRHPDLGDVQQEAHGDLARLGKGNDDFGFQQVSKIRVLNDKRIAIGEVNFKGPERPTMQEFIERFVHGLNAGEPIRYFFDFLEGADWISEISEKSRKIKRSRFGKPR